MQFAAIPTTGRGNVAGACAALFALTQHGDCPEWVQNGASELLRDYHVTMMPTTGPLSCEHCPAAGGGCIVCRTEGE